ncbi:hypothetical protein GCM10028820_28180 [Tessaracoccus terricola]
MLHSFHLARVGVPTALRALLRPPSASSVPGLRRMEAMAGMGLGAPVLSPARMQLHRLAVFAEWSDERSLADFLTRHRLGRALAQGWHVRMQFLRRWGAVAEFAHLPEEAARSRPAEPVVAVTLARTRLPELPRFIRWGRPVEEQVRDHPDTTLALAAMRPPRTVSTFSVWESTRAMTGMVWGRDTAPDGGRHSGAMGERERRDFHHEFTTLRFRPLSEHGSWEGRSGYVPGLPEG